MKKKQQKMTEGSTNSSTDMHFNLKCVLCVFINALNKNRQQVAPLWTSIVQFWSNSESVWFCGKFSLYKLYKQREENISNKMIQNENKTEQEAYPDKLVDHFLIKMVN